MSMTLYHAPGACSRVTMAALEEIGVAYEDRGLSIAQGAQKTPEYLAINPKGKVPALVIDGRVLTENPTILYYLATTFPKARLLPLTGDAVGDARVLSDLVWFGGTVHPNVRQIMRPVLFSQVDAAGVKASGITAFRKLAEEFSARLEDHWWYGDTWSIADVYLYWTYTTAAVGGFPLSEYPVLEAHARRVTARPSLQRALAREEVAIARDGAVPGVPR